MGEKICSTKFCRNKCGNNSFCKKCFQIQYRERHPVKAAYVNLKHNAKRRNKQFDLTFEQFEQFAIETNYMIGKGRSKTSFHIDRIDPEKGYSIDNIRVLTNSENVRRHNIYLKYQYGQDGKPDHFRVEPSIKIDLQPTDDCPF